MHGPLSPKSVRLKLLVPRAFNALPVVDADGSWGAGVRVSPLLGQAPCMVLLALCRW